MLHSPGSNDIKNWIPETRERETKMKRKRTRKPLGGASSPAGNLSPKEKKALKVSIQAANSQADGLGILDALELEPVLVYSLQERRK